MIRPLGRVVQIAIAAVFATIALSACTASSEGPLSLGSDTDQDTLCSSIAKSTPMIIADTVTAPADAAVEFISVAPIKAAGVKITAFYLSKLDPDEAALGNAYFPPEGPTKKIWGNRHPIEGFELGPGQRANLLVVAERTGDGVATIQNIEVRYRSGDSEYEKTASTIYEFSANCNE